MLARVAQVTTIVMVAGCLVTAGSRDARAQALCPQADARHFRELDEVSQFEVRVPHAPETKTIEADLASLRDTLPGSTWRMANFDGISSDGLALEGVSLTRTPAPGIGSNTHTFEVAVDLRASDRILVELELVLIDGERRLPLAALNDIPVRCEAKSVPLKISISDDDFASFFAAGRAPELRVKRTTIVNGC
jgi:hypothetical protein